MKTNYSAEKTFEVLKQRLGFNTDVKLADWLGVTAQSFHATKKRGGLPESWAKNISSKLGLSIEELLNAGRARASFASHEDFDDFFQVPLVAARLSAGTGSFETEDSEIGRFAFRYDWLRRKGIPEKMVLMRVRGDSMEPKIAHNDLVLIDQSKTSVIPFDIYAVGFDDAIYIKQLRPQPGRKLQLHSFNPEYRPIDIDLSEESPDECRIIGKAIWCCHEL
ncbi:MAG: helix-turn-helix domain-containing protein [Mailhella sp.]|nr:helix-turn-helix domain-containing protein [Mailhella sp.]